MITRSDPTAESRDPLVWCWAIAATFLALALHRIGTPAKPFFDEVHYLPAARALLALSEPVNLEHPWFAKQLIALGIAAFGDNPLGWRVPSAVAAAGTLLAAMRALWWASLSRPATQLLGGLLATNFLLFVTARIAMLDGFMLAFTMAALWLCARALRRPLTARRDLALAGVALGLSLASKWSGAAVAALPGLAFAALRLQGLAGRRSLLLTARDVAPIPGVSLIEAGLWLGVLPAAVYFATFVPLAFFTAEAIGIGDIFPLQLRMAELQSSVIQGHPYQSQWWQWTLNLRPIWYLYEHVDGAQRGVLLLGNPLTMMVGLPALAACLAWGLIGPRPAMLSVALLWLASMSLWLVADKPVQFSYHYLLPACFVSAALALVLGAWWERERKWPALLVLGGATALFAYFYPILSASSLESDQSFLEYAWLESWR